MLFSGTGPLYSRLEEELGGVTPDEEPGAMLEEDVPGSSEEDTPCELDDSTFPLEEILTSASPETSGAP